jgi:hypothetical protein
MFSLNSFWFYFINFQQNGIFTLDLNNINFLNFNFLLLLIILINLIQIALNKKTNLIV